MEKKSITADVYNIGNEEGLRGSFDYLWVFGSFSCTGTEDSPLSCSNIYMGVSQETDMEFLENIESTQKEVTLYTWDYKVFIPLSEELKNKEFLTNDVYYFIDGKPYTLDHEVTDNNGDEYVLLTCRTETRLERKEKFDKCVSDGSWEKAVSLN